MRSPVNRGRIQAVRRFSRFYTRRMGVLQEGLLGSAYSLTEVRVLYEIAHRAHCTASQIGNDLGLDAGYLSRMLARFASKRLVRRERSASDGRELALRLTPNGRKVFGVLDQESNAQVAAMLREVSESDQSRVVRAMSEVESVLSGSKGETRTKLRQHRPGDIGWVIHRHGVLYAQEYGWDKSFEALVAEIAAQFLRNFDPDRERCWIAESNGDPVGSVFLVKHSDKVAKLRLLLVEPRARGLGIGRKLVDECIRFARQAGYSKLTLWTQSNLSAARHTYERAGFTLVKEEPQRAFGAELVSETWELEL
jgi:DNA-binding MarR family transcriptional regulator/GNAT superfamily N-acetyltransferase